MSNGYVLADTNSLVYAYRAGGAKLLDTYQEMAKAERRELAITKTVRDEIEKGPLNAELLRYIADKNIPILDNPRTEQRLRVREITSKNAGEESIVENAKREHAAGRNTPVLSDDRYFASPQKMREAPGVQPATSAELLNQAREDRFITESRYREHLAGYQAQPEFRAGSASYSPRLNTFDPHHPTLIERVGERLGDPRTPPIGLKVIGASFVMHDILTTGQKALRLLDQGNVTGAQSEILHFGARNLGMAGAAALGARAGAAFGGVPGLVIGGAMSGVAGAVVGDKLLDAADRARIYHQRGSDGNAWHLDERPGHGWMRMSADEGPGRGGMPMRPVYADARLADELNYKASSVAVELALARPPAPQDPYSHTPETIGEQVRAGIGASQPWTRDPHSHVWTRQATEAATPMTHGMPVQRTLSASPEQTLQLEAAARRTMADNIARSPQAMAQRYLEAYAQHGWKQHGPVPAAVVDAAPGPVREERNVTPKQTPAQPQPQPASGHPTPQQIERITTHESRIVPTPGGMSFAEAHRRRDEPEQISPGSLRPVGKLDVSNLDKSSPLYRMHLAQEQAHMRDLEIALAQDRERFKNEPSPQRTPQPSVERTQERTPRHLLEEAPVQKQAVSSAPEVQVQVPAPIRGAQVVAPVAQDHLSPARAAAAAEAMHSPTVHASAAAPVHSNPQGAAAAIAAAQAEAAAARAESADMRRQMARMAEQRRQDDLERRDERDQRETTQQVAQSHDSRRHPEAATHEKPISATAGADTSRPLLRDFSDPGHSQNALYNDLKERFPEGTLPEWLTYSTAACYKSGIKRPDDLGDIEGRDGRIFFSPNSVFAQGVVVDVTQPAPSVQQTMQEVQQFDQQRADNLARYQAQIAQANQQQGQGPVM
jgi:hypothetical protein